MSTSPRRLRLLGLSFEGHLRSRNMDCIKTRQVFSWCLCAVCGKERCLWHQPVLPLNSKVPSLRVLFLGSPLWEWQKKPHACLLPCRWNNCCVIWEVWHIQGISEPTHEPIEPHTWLLRTEVTLVIDAILGARLGRDSLGHACCFFSRAMEVRLLGEDDSLGVEEILEDLSDAWVFSAPFSPSGPNLHLHPHFLNTSQAVHAISEL